MPIFRDIPICEIPPQGLMPSRKVGVIIGSSNQEEDLGAYGGAYLTHGGPVTNYWLQATPKLLVSHRLRWLDARQRQLRLWETSSEEEVRAYSIPLVEAFHHAAGAYPQVSVTRM